MDDEISEILYERALLISKDSAVFRETDQISCHFLIYYGGHTSRKI